MSSVELKSIFNHWCLGTIFHIKNRIVIPASTACRHVESLLKPWFICHVYFCTSESEKTLVCIYNTIFNFLTDTIILLYNLNSSIYIKVPMLSRGITWWTDKYIKFQNPKSIDLPSAFEGKIHTLV